MRGYRSYRAQRSHPRSGRDTPQLTSDTHNQESVSSSDTTLSWHGSGRRTSPVPSSVLNLPRSFAAPCARQVMCTAGSDLVFSEDEFFEEGQQLQASPDVEEKSSASSCRSATSTIDSHVGAGVASGQERGHETGEDGTSDDDDDDDDGDDDVTDQTWELGQQGALSASGGEGSSRPKRQQEGGSMPIRQQGGSSRKSIVKCARGRQSSTQEPICQQTISAKKARQGTGRQSYSPVWEFFIRSLEDVSVAICTLCGKEVKRGQGPNYCTTALRQHMVRHHRLAWENSGKNVVGQADAASDASSSGPTNYSRLQSISEAITKKQQYTCSHPRVQNLNMHLAKLLVLQSLPFHVVDSAPFRELMDCVEPRWRVPSRHYFSTKAVPALHTYIKQKVGQSLSLSVSGTVHASADVWSCNYGQGQYMSFTAHWVNVVREQTPHQPGQVTAMPPLRSHTVIPALISSSNSSSSTASSASTMGTGQGGPTAYHLCRARRCHAVLHLASLDERSHTGEKLLRVLHQEIKSWLSPRQLKVGTVVTDNGKNMISALCQEGLSHATCMVHVFNLVVTRFLKSSTQLQDILLMARKLCMHFRHSYRAKQTLLDLQKRNGVPLNWLICDVPTRWNSTLHMLDRLYEQRKALTDFLMMQADRATPLCNLELGQWQLMRDTCRLLRHFEEATLFVSHRDCGMNDVIPLLHILEGLLISLTGQGTQDVVPTSAGHQVPFEVDLTIRDEDIRQDLFLEEGGLSPQSTEEEQEEHQEREVDEEDLADDPDTPWQYSVEMEAGSPSHSLVEMARHMLSCLRNDSHIITIRQRDDYWIATMLDPRYRSKMGAFFSPSERDEKINYYRGILCSRLVSAYVRRHPSSQRSNLGGPESSSSTAMTAGGRTGVAGGKSSTSSVSSNLSLESLMSSFLQPPTEETSQDQQEDMEENLHQQVAAYLDCTISPHVKDPLDYWAAKLELWPQLAEFALGKLSCPASSVASERVFNVAKSIVNQSRTCLSSQSKERLTFIKMNQAWIEQDFQTPVPDATD